MQTKVATASPYSCGPTWASAGTHWLPVWAPSTLALALLAFIAAFAAFFDSTAPPLPQILPTLPCFFCPSILSHIMFPNSRGLDRAPLCSGRHANGYLRWNNQKGNDPLSSFTWPRNFTYVICAHTRGGTRSHNHVIRTASLDKHRRGIEAKVRGDRRHKI